jgi:hypothetical protein
MSRVRLLSRASVLLLLFMTPSGRLAAADDAALLSAADVSFLLDSGFIKRAPAQARSDLGPYIQKVHAEGIHEEALYLADHRALECVLARAAARRTNIAELFTEKVFLTGGSLSILLEADALSQSAEKYDFHSPFPVSTTLTDGSTAHMTFLLAGQGKLIIGYDRQGAYHHPDPEYTVEHFNGYDVDPYVKMDIVGDGLKKRALERLAVADTPTEKLRPYNGPGDFVVKSLTVQGNEIRASTRIPFFTPSIRPKPVAERTGDSTRAARLAAWGCPADGAWVNPAL